MGHIMGARRLRSLPLRGSITPLLPRVQFIAFTNSIQSRQTFKTSAMQQPIFSHGEEENKLMDELNKLFESGWKLDNEKMGITKTYHFKTYTKVLVVGIGSKSKNHHSIMELGFGHVSVHWTTHNPRGLSSKDTSMAQYCDDQGSLIKTVDKDKSAKCGPGPGTQT